MVAASSRSLHHAIGIYCFEFHGAPLAGIVGESFPWLDSSLLLSPHLFPFTLHPPRSPCIPLSGKSFAGRQFKVQDRTMALYISIPQLRRRFSPGLDKKKGTLVRDDQPRETVAKDGAGIMSRIGREGCKPPSKEVEEFCSFCRVFVCPFIYHSFFYSDVLLWRFNVHAVKLLYLCV